MTIKIFANVKNISLLLGILLLMMGANAMVKAQVKNGSKAMDNSLVTTDKNFSPAIPPIDATAPATFETASFGLG